MRSLFIATVVAAGLLACTAPTQEEISSSEDELGEARGAKVLRVDYQVQETGYWCGPAATRVAISARKAAPNQRDVARQLGTTTNGTDHIGQVTSVLNAHFGAGTYFTQEMPNDPPTPAQRDKLWNDIVRNIDSGYVVVTNIVAPPSNHPPGYPARTIYHYFAVIGYNGQTRQVYIADSANFGGNRLYWLSFNQLATLIPPKGYSAANVGTHCAAGEGTTGGAIDAKYRSLGGCGSILGAPLTEELATPDRVGRYNVFQNGSIYWTPRTGAHEVHGRIRDAWRDKGWEAGALGYPTSDELDVPEGKKNEFEHGRIVWKRATNETAATIF